MTDGAWLPAPVFVFAARSCAFGRFDRWFPPLKIKFHKLARFSSVTEIQWGSFGYARRDEYWCNSLFAIPRYSHLLLL